MKPGDHLCVIYESEEEHCRLLTCYLCEGLARNDKIVYIADARSAATILEYLRDNGIDMAPHLKSGQLNIVVAEDAYLPDGEFVPDRMIALLREESGRAVSEGYRALRTTGEMSWALRALPGSERLIEYETKLNGVFPECPAIVLCQYDKRRFEPDFLLKVLATHPIAILGTEVCDNFYFMSSGEFMSADHRGTMLNAWIRNLKERKGYIERLRENEVPARDIDHGPGKKRGTGTILLADDEEILLLFGQSVLEGKGYKVVKTCNWNEALKSLAEKESEISLAILDWSMPGKEGREAIIEIFQMAPDLPVIICSSYTADYFCDLPKDHCHAYLPKSYTPSQMVDLVRKMMARHALHEGDEP